MRMGASLFLLAFGAAMTWWLKGSIAGVNLPVMGALLMGIGAAGLAVSLGEARFAGKARRR